MLHFGIESKILIFFVWWQYNLLRLVIYNMNIVIINGSPKGANSITYQSCLYLQRKFPHHDYHVLHVGQSIKQIERDFSQSLALLNDADLLLFSYPVYTFLVPSQLHRFVELMKNHVDDGSLKIGGKWATQITTSKHFYDVTAHRFVEENCADMNLMVLPGLSADMDDLLTEKGRREVVDFFDYIHFQINGCASVEFMTEKTVAIVVDLEEGDEALKLMLDEFVNALGCRHKIFNIREFPFKGGCLSCFHCSGDGKCIYADNFDSFLRKEIQTCDAIVYAFSIKDHSMGSRFKMYDDRQFCNGHRTVTMGSPTGYIVNGDYLHEPNLQMVLEGRANVGGNYLCGVALSDETVDPIHRTTNVQGLAAKLSYALSRGYRQPANFFGVGGMTIFRDLIYLMRGMMRADHQFFKSHGQYDFPQKKWVMSLKMYLVGWLMRNKTIQSKAGSKMTEGMLKPYKDALEK